MKKVLSVLLAMTLCFVLALTSFAAVSPTPDKYYTVEAQVAVVGTGSALANPTSGTAGKLVVLTATAEKGFVFDHWELDGKFEIVQGTTKDPVITIVIVPESDNKTHGALKGDADIIGVAHFKPISSEVTTGEQQTAKPDKGPVAPQTGIMDTQAIAVIAFAVIGLMSVAVVYKKRTEKTK